MRQIARKHALSRLLSNEATPGLLLMAAAMLALIASNSALAPVHDFILNVPIAVQVGALEIAKPLFLWVNDGLMAIFFFLVQP